MTIVEAPHVAAICAELARRPVSYGAQPHEVRPEIYAVAQEELTQALRIRGWPLQCADIGRPNFLLMGIPVCPAVHH